jgi:PAS domain S-box-containing protein
METKSDVFTKPESTQQPFDEGNSATGKVLVVSGNSELIEICRLMEHRAAAVFTCESGSQALGMVEEVLPDLVVADLGTLDLDIKGLVGSVKGQEEQVPVILVADVGDQGRGAAALEDGAYDVIFRPLDPRIFMSAIRRGLERTSLIRFQRDHQRIVDERVEKETHQIARRSDFLKGILDSSTQVSVVLTDLDQTVRFWNKGAENIFGYTADEIIGAKITKLYPPDETSAETVNRMRDLVRTKTGTVHGKMKQVAKDGRVLTMLLALSPMVDRTGEVQGILGMGQDVTEETRLNEELSKSFDLLKRTQDVSIFSLAKLAESRDEETGLHLLRIQEYCRVLCARLAKRGRYREEMTRELIDDLARSSVLHDIGKVTIPDSILMCREKFKPEEIAIMRRHPVFGGKALEEAEKKPGEKSFLSMGSDVAYYHHEHWDGNGYPFGLKREEIPLSARIVAIVDVYDALTTERRYKGPSLTRRLIG